MALTFAAELSLIKVDGNFIANAATTGTPRTPEAIGAMQTSATKAFIATQTAAESLQDEAAPTASRKLEVDAFKVAKAEEHLAPSFAATGTRY